MENKEPKIEWIGPKTLVIVRVPNSMIEDEEKPLDQYFADISACNDHFVFITVRQDSIDQIEFEYPKNYRSVEDKQPIGIISRNFMQDEDCENFIKATKNKYGK